MTSTPFPVASRAAAASSSTTLGATPAAEALPAPDDHAVIGFLQRWYAYGGGRSEDILVEFGLSTTQFFTRAKDLLESKAVRVDPAVADAMLTVCRKRLWLGQ
ncbi:DUF3263 domain-containing protein [Rhodococcoides corynebacterioides]|uniref:DUF3263 domain-containing protein n=1 Tax=Rhodococcoides corynebacterioides TaxID=53972 RepID=UPI001C9A4424|nr:DUF3263 domain-containing protein [Rhodococcus corynebacterioides]MBY6365026.1 DUF3263 domain-containing protein [Rhodococcus corynebacterioides]